VIQAVIGAASFAQGAASAAQSFAGAASNRKDQERAARAASELRNALAGDLRAAQFIYSQTGRLAGSGSATAFGKQQYEAAWQQIVAQRPELALQAVPGGYEQSQIGFPDATPSTRERIGDEIERLRDRVRSEAGDAAQRLLTGAAPRVGESVAGEPRGTRSLLPGVSTSTMWILGAVLLGALALWWISKR
jgi:hypothetical protein